MSLPTSSLVERHDADAVATLTLNAPGSLNALSDAMLAAVQAHLDALALDRSVRVIILRGAGKAFCAGHDLKEMTAGRDAPDGGKAYFEDLFSRCSTLMTTLTRLPQPVIAQVHGVAAAAGCQLVAQCDLAVADTGTRFGVNGVNIGLFCSTPMVALSRNIGRKKTFELLTTGDFLTADQAQEYGLINRAVPLPALEAEAQDMATTIAAKLGRAVAVGKQAFYDQLDLPLAQAYAHTGRVMAQNMLFDETAEGIAAFIGKRPATWDQ